MWSNMRYISTNEHIGETGYDNERWQTDNQPCFSYCHESHYSEEHANTMSQWIFRGGFCEVTIFTGDVRVYQVQS